MSLPLPEELNRKIKEYTEFNIHNVETKEQLTDILFRREDEEVIISHISKEEYIQKLSILIDEALKEVYNDPKSYKMNETSYYIEIHQLVCTNCIERSNKRKKRFKQRNPGSTAYLRSPEIDTCVTHEYVKLINNRYQNKLYIGHGQYWALHIPRNNQREQEAEQERQRERLVKIQREQEQREEEEREQLAHMQEQNRLRIEAMEKKEKRLGPIDRFLKYLNPNHVF